MSPVLRGGTPENTMTIEKALTDSKLFAVVHAITTPLG
jgi:hypothetical protein